MHSPPPMATTLPRRYTCETAAETLDWMNAIAAFLSHFRFLIDAHVVNFFKDRLWEAIDSQWMECLKKESVETLLGLPSGMVQGHWPPSLGEFVATLRSLVLPREQNLSNAMLENLHVAPLSSVLSQGMNSKKKHEVEILAATVSTTAHAVNADKVIDVGSGQGYLAQVLSFEYQYSVVAIDSSLHHSAVTSARASRIKKHYAAKLHKLQHGDGHLKVPQTVTSQILSSDSLAALCITLIDDQKQSDRFGSSLKVEHPRISELGVCKAATPCNNEIMRPSSVLTGLHACGDLSVNMLKAFVDCQQLKGLVSVGCCYNLLTEESSKKSISLSGFPLSKGARLLGLKFGKNAFDLACQSAERWKCLPKNAALQNFELHAFRAAFQMVLDNYYPEIMASRPSIGRQGKALRRQQMRRVVEFTRGSESLLCSCNQKDGINLGYSSIDIQPDKIEVIEEHHNGRTLEESSSTNSEGFSERHCCYVENKAMYSTSSNTYLLFSSFSKAGLHRLGFENMQDVNLHELWERVTPFLELVGPYWSLRAALGPLLETYILLDRLLFLQEHSDFVEASLIPLFDPALSPRNVAIIARKI